MVDDKTGSLICYLISAHMLYMKSASLNDNSQLRFSKGYP